jgi:hypothetical protein
VLMILLLVAALAGVMVTGGMQAGWLALAFAVVVGPVIVLLDGRARNRASRAAEARVNARDRFRSPASPQRPERRLYRAAA